MTKNGTKLTAAQERHVQRLVEAEENPAFVGALEFRMTFGFLGGRYDKNCRVLYEFTPEWDYYDGKSGEIRPGVECLSYHLEIEAVPEVRQRKDLTWQLGKPYWKRFDDFIADDVFSHDMQDAIVDAIDEKCRAEDAERRKAAGRK
jgi:hypothetical protein